MLIKNRNAEFRLAWRLVLLVALFLGAAYLLSYIPIRVQTAIFVNQGFSRSMALSRARYMILEDPVWSSVVGIMQGLLWYRVIRFMVSAFERRPFSLDDLGFAPRRGNLLLVPLGLVLASIMYLGALRVGRFFNEAAFSWSPSRLQTTAIALVSLDLITNAIGEETAFRAYFQYRLTQQHGECIGVVLASSSFVRLHPLVYRFSALVMVASMLLAATYSILYAWPSDAGMLIAHGVGLLAVILLFRLRDVQTRTLALTEDRASLVTGD